jgi:hypothetical protein
VLDPACGEGVFLEAARRRLSEAGGTPTSQVFGIEINRTVYNRSLIPLLTHFDVSRQNIVLSDFFDVSPSSLPQFEAVVGNPPFIRYQTFKGESREKALRIARTLGASLSELTSSWAPFILHATQFLAPNGRLAMVVPAEITHAAYARPVVQYLARRFGRISIASFKERLFPELNQDTFLLFAEGFGGQCKELRLKRFEDIRQAESQLRSVTNSGAKINVRELQTTNGRLRNHFLPREIAALYRFLGVGSKVCHLGNLAKVGIGYVTGANQFFHLSVDEVERFEIPKQFLRPSLLRGGIIKGLRISRDEWRELRSQDEKVYLLSLPRVHEHDLPKGLRKYLVQGEERGIANAYKCAVRTPWYSVPHSSPAHAFLTYMSGEAPRIAWNEARLLATNSLHEVRLTSTTTVVPWKIACAFCCSLSQLSSEIEGHPLGGGMLKLEPSEAERVLIARPETLRVGRNQFEEIDVLVRSNMMGAAMDLADEIILRDTLALTWDQIQVMREGLREIRESRRKKFGATGSN